MTRGNARRTGRILGALAAAALLFALLESGIERRIGADLFLPFRDGQFLPGRAARMGAWLVLCLAAALTDRGRSYSARLRSALRKDRYCWLAAAALTGLFFLWASRVTVPSFMTSDEVGILGSIRSVPTRGLRGATATFSHVLFCGLIGSFYSIDPDFWWYTCYHFVIIALSLTIIGRCVFLLLRDSRWVLVAGTAIHALTCAGIFMYTIAELSFTVTPAVAGCGAVALVLCRGKTDSRAGHICTDAASVILMLLCILQRKDTGQCLLCFFSLAVGYQCLRTVLDRGKGWPGRLAAVACVFLAVMALFSASKYVTRSTSLARNGAFSSAESARSRVVDFLIEDMTDEDFESVGIPPELGKLLRGWFFMDERITTDTLRDLARSYSARHKSELQEQPEAASLSTSVITLLAKIQDDPQMLWRALCLVSLLGLTVGLVWYAGKARWLELLCALCAVGGAGILLLYLVIQGRFPTRVFLVVVLPALVTVLLMALTAASPSSSGGHQTFSLVLAGLFAAAAALCCCVSLFHVPHVLDAATPDDLFGRERATEDYANAHPDTLFITNIYDNNLDPFHDSHYPSNRDLWGDGGDTYRTEGRLYADAFFRDDVRFMTDDVSSVVLLMQYLTLDYGPVQALVEAQLQGNVYIFRISRIGPADPDYTGWHEQNGMTYYFRNGEALTGEQTIDREEYTFSPIGGNSQFAASRSPEGLIYFTNAYSLISPEA